MKKVVLAIMMAMMAFGGVFASVPAMAAVECGDKSYANLAEAPCCAEANILGDKEYNGKRYKCDDGKGSGVLDILRLVVNILSVGVGVLGVLGIVIAGIQYLTSAGNEEQMRKAKRRIFEIVIGLAAYVLIYALLSWLLPGFQGI